MKLLRCIRSDQRHRHGKISKYHPRYYMQLCVLFILTVSFTCLGRLSPLFGKGCRRTFPEKPAQVLTMLREVLDAPGRLLQEGRESRKLVLVVVFVALLLDNMLLTVVGTSGSLCWGNLSGLPQHTR